MENEPSPLSAHESSMQFEGVSINVDGGLGADHPGWAYHHLHGRQEWWGGVWARHHHCSQFWGLRSSGRGMAMRVHRAQLKKEKKPFILAALALWKEVSHCSRKKVSMSNMKMNENVPVARECNW